jgi:betaine-aldehyde dehydrogenase
MPALWTEIKGETIPASGKNLHFTLREPYGVVGRIIPFNHPIKFAANALAAPLVAGNCVVLKPPDTSPLSATILGEICRNILPPGVVNIVTGLGMPAGDALARHPKVKRLAFTGSVPTGRAIQRAATEGGIKHVTLELGGKNPLIAFPDMDPDKVAQVAVAGMNFAWQGQSCGSTTGYCCTSHSTNPCWSALSTGSPLCGSAIRLTTNRRWGRSTPSATMSAFAPWWSPDVPKARG